MKLHHVANNTAVQLGDFVRRVDGRVGTIRGWEHPQAPGDTGYAIVRLEGDAAPVNVEPSMLNLEWRSAPAYAQLLKFDVPRRELFRRAFKDAQRAGQPTFSFENHEFLVDYAYYLLQFLDAEL